jgi:DNA invertase Pin-like site-specific DNA recombinase
MRETKKKKTTTKKRVAAAKSKPTLIGYQRVSTDDQKLELQKDALHAAGIHSDHIYEDKLSGAKIDRPGLEHAIRACRAGGVLVVWRLDRLGRSLKDLIAIVERLEERGVGLRSLQEQIDTLSASGRLFFHIMGALAEFERNLARERTRAGLLAARRRGKKPGRKKRFTDTQVKAARAMLKAGELTVAEVAGELKVSPATLYRYFPGGREAIE